VKVRGVDVAGKAFEVDAVLDNLSGGGLHMRLERKVREGTELFTVIRFSHPQVESETGPRVATRGIVLRVTPLPEGSYGVAVEFTRHRFL
jgi:hypothetical protein